MEVGERITVDGGGAVGVGLLATPFMGACTDAIRPPFPEAKLARVNLIAGTFGEGTAGGLLRRACAMWYSFDSPAGTKSLRGGDGGGGGDGDGDGEGVKFCFFSIWVMTAGVGTGTTGLEVVTSIFIS